MAFPNPFAKVEKGEGVRVGLMVASVFLIMTAYYAMKIAREGLILAGGTFGLKGDELKTYATGAMALLMVGVVPAYDMLAERHRRIRVLNISYAAVLASLVGVMIQGVFFEHYRRRCEETACPAPRLPFSPSAEAEA